MTIDEAIKELQNWNSQTFETRFVTFLEAKELSVEALKAIGQWNEHQMPQHQFHLPGETK